MLVGAKNLESAMAFTWAYNLGLVGVGICSYKTCAKITWYKTLGVIMRYISKQAIMTQTRAVTGPQEQVWILCGTKVILFIDETGRIYQPN